MRYVASYQIISLTLFLGLSGRLASAFGEAWWASFAFAFATATTLFALFASATAFLALFASALATTFFASASATAFLVLLSTFANARAVAFILGASFQFLAVADNENALGFDGGLFDFQGSFLRRAGRTARR